jgi:cellulose synthase/poly-beta-1,6-N-acetylglucosamine synthase-like glycosyltransferase
MIFDWLASLFEAIALAACAIIAIFIVGKFLFIGLHLSLRRSGLAEERQKLASALPADDSLPDVVVQLPVYNESEIVKRAISAAAALDWPKDKLHIQVCDDSTDNTTEYANATRTQLANSGINIEVIHRSNRNAFKAGSLQAAMERVPHQYFAIFDVDYLPSKDFLRRCMAVLLSDPKLAFVQARADFLNRNENALTRTQALELDAHYGVEQATRSWAALPLPFNGTCGIWRRTAIEAGGGWQGKTIAEDMELSYAAWLKGWRGIFVTSVVVPGELPADRKTWKSQQDRWITGTGQVLQTALFALLGSSQISLTRKFLVFCNLATWWLAAAINTMFLTLALTCLLKPPLAPVLLFAALAVLLCLLLALFLEFRLGNVLLHGHARSLAGFFCDFLFYIAFTLYKLWLHFRSVCRSFFKPKPEFARTPKRGVENTNS